MPMHMLVSAPLLHPRLKRRGFVAEDLIIRDNISDAVPMIAKAGACRESQGMLIINAPKKATIRIRKKF